MRVVLIGQAAFGEAVLKALTAHGEQVVAVFHGEDEAGRSDPLKEAAQKLELPTYSTALLRQKDFFPTYQELKPDLNVMAFVTLLIPERVLHFPTHTTIQYHPSLLPKHRGKSAINWAMVNGDTKTGLTIFWPDRGIDTGPILLQKEVDIGPDDTVGSIYFNKLFPMGVDAIVEAVGLIKAGKAPRRAQDEAEATYEPPFEGDLSLIQWFRPARQVYNHVRGCNPQPGALTRLRGEGLKLYDVALVERKGAGFPGEVVALTSDGFVVAMNGANLLVKRVAPEGGSKVKAGEFAQQVGLKVGERLGA